MDESIKDSKAQIIFVVGPTATGKSDLSILLAEHFKAEIINADSIQFYNQIEIGTAKPSKDMLERVPHHLISFVEPPHTLSAGDFSRAAEKLITERRASGVNKFVLVGGSGFYIQALEKGMVPAPQIDDATRAQVQQQFESQGSVKLWKEIEKFDPEYAQKISPNDSYRVQRALEILLSSPKTISAAQHEFESQGSSFKKNFHIHKLALDIDRDELRLRVGLRTEQMLRANWIEEVQELRALGFSGWAPLSSVGYFEIGEFLDAKISKADLKGRIMTSTMQLAKKQRTWFRRDQEIHWLNNVTADSKLFFQNALKHLAIG